MTFTIEDILMYSLELGYPNIVKACLLKLPKESLAMSSACQIRLAVATLPQVITESADAAQLISSQHLLTMSQILRSIQFIRSKCPVAGGCRSFCLAGIKLKKCIIMHFIYTEPTNNIVLSHLCQQFGPNIVHELMKPTQNLRLFNVIKREVNNFTQLVKELMNNKEKRLNYLQTKFWQDYNAQFWQDLHFDVVSYLNTIVAYLPALNIEKVLEQETSNHNLQSKLFGKLRKNVGDEITLNENFLIELLQCVSAKADNNTAKMMKNLINTSPKLLLDDNKENNNKTNNLHNKENITKGFYKKNFDQHLHSESCLQEINKFSEIQLKNEITPTCGYSEALEKQTVNKIVQQCPQAINSNKKQSLKIEKNNCENIRPAKRRKLLCAEEAAQLLCASDNSDIENSPCLSRQTSSMMFQEDGQIISSFSESKSTSSKNTTCSHNPQNFNLNRLSELPVLTILTHSPKKNIANLRKSSVLTENNGPLSKRCVLRSHLKPSVKVNLPHFVNDITSQTTSSAPQNRERTFGVNTRSHKKRTRRKLMYNLNNLSENPVTKDEISLINKKTSELELEPLGLSHFSAQLWTRNDVDFRNSNTVDGELIPESDCSDTESVELSMDPFIPTLSSHLGGKSFNGQPLKSVKNCNTKLCRLKSQIRFIDSLDCAAIQNVLIQNPDDIECILNEM